ncbi:ataxin-7-like protein 2b [Solea solea]|uniref:ataxin-7-like protein 2b n=1 Tax=Solea solea TaxID=90069 RepID=UPI0027299FC5|nr:ataxin-7-like protein 2b [Solea solea]
MAALNRRNPNLDDFVGLNWSCWIERVDILPSDAGSDPEDGSKYGKSLCETMALRKEDMHIYGHCPAQDDIYLVVCSHCGQVVKPEAFEKHCERRHGPLIKMCSQQSTVAPQQRPRPGQPPSNVSLPRERQKDGRHHEDGATSTAASSVHQHRPSKAQSLPSEEKFPQEKPPLPQHSASMPHPRVPACHSGQTNESHTPPCGTRTYSRTHKNTEKKECDLNKHSTILNPKRKPSSRGLICNTDAIHQQQKTLGTNKTVEQRIASVGQDVNLLDKLEDKEQHLEAFEENVTQHTGYNCHIIGTSRDPAENLPEEEGDSTVKVEIQPPYPFNQSLLSSEESENDEQEETTDLPTSPWHPKPLGVCTFGCRTLGCSIVTFDRRLHHLRFALSTMFEHHLNAHLWKKMPQASSGLRSCHVTPPTVRKSARPSQSFGYLMCESTSLGPQLETKNSKHNSQSIKPPSTSSSSLKHGRCRNNIRRPSKAQLKEVVVMQDESATKLPLNAEEKSSRFIRDSPLHEKGQQQNPSCQGPASGAFSCSKKPCPPLPLQPSERRLSLLEKRSPSPAIKEHASCRRVRSRPQKRKGSNESLAVSTSLPRTSKCKRLSSPSRPSLHT